MEAESLRGLLQTLTTAIAVAEVDTWEISWENARFFEWFPPNGEVDAPLHARLTGLDAERARARLAKGKPYRLDAEAGSGARAREASASSSGSASWTGAPT